MADPALQRAERSTRCDCSRAAYTEQWKRLLLRSVGFEPELFSGRARHVLLLRMVSFVVRNYNMVELGLAGRGSRTSSSRSPPIRT